MARNQTEYAIKQIVRALLKNEDEGMHYSPENAVAKAICGIDEYFCDQVNHYLSGYSAVKKWRDGLDPEYQSVAMCGVGPVFCAGDKTNRYFGCPDDRVMPKLANDIANGCLTYLHFFDTKDGYPQVRREMPVSVRVDPQSKEYGVAWSIITKHEQYGGNYTRTIFPIDAFEHGREFLLSMVYWLYSGLQWSGNACKDMDMCHDWTDEIFGDLNENGEVVNLKLAEKKEN